MNIISIVSVTCKKKKSVVRSVCEKVSDSVARTIYLEPIKIESCDKVLYNGAYLL